MVATQLHTYLTNNNFFEALQYGFCKFHSITETVLVKVENDILLADDSGCLSILILLNLSAFNTIDHAVLFFCLETVFIIKLVQILPFRA